MTVYTRQGTAPIEEGDDLDPSEVDAEFESIRAIINQGIDGANNIHPSAGITGAQIASGTLTESNVTPSTLTTASLNASAVMKAYVSSGDGAATGLVTTPATWANLPVVAETTLTPGGSGDMIAMDCTLTMAFSASPVNYDFGFSVAGSDVGVVAVGPNNPGTSLPVSLSFSWMQAATSATPVAIRPRYKPRVADITAVASSLPTGYLVVFRAFIIPIK